MIPASAVVLTVFTEDCHISVIQLFLFLSVNLLCKEMEKKNFFLLQHFWVHNFFERLSYFCQFFCNCNTTVCQHL